MKIITNENGSTVAFLQGKDLVFIKKYKKDIPALLRNQIVREGNQREFYCFTDEDSVRFIEEEKSFLDYMKMVSFPEDSLKQKIYKVNHEKQKKFHDMDKIRRNISAEKEDKQVIIDKLSLQKELELYLEQYEALQIQTSDLGVLMDLKRGKFFPELPLISTGERFSFVDYEDGMHEITSSLNPNQLLCFRKDKQPFEPEKFNNSNFIKKAVPLAIIEKQSRGELNFEFDINQKYSFKNEYLIIEFLPKEYQQEPEKEGKVMELIRKFIKIS